MIRSLVGNKMLRILFCCFVLLHIFQDIVNSQTCTSFKNVLVNVIDIEGINSTEIVDGCIQRIGFGNRTITHVYVKQQKIPILGRDSIRNMKHLAVVSFYGCHVDLVEPRSFRNLPGLRKFQISFCKVKKISTGKLIYSITHCRTLLSSNHHPVSYCKLKPALPNLSK